MTGKAQTSGLISLLLIFVTVLSVLVVPSRSRADILFIDFNWSTKEIEGARAAAEARHERLVVLPELPSGLRNQFRGLWDKIEPGRIATGVLMRKVSYLSALLTAVPGSKVASALDPDNIHAHPFRIDAPSDKQKIMAQIADLQRQEDAITKRDERFNKLYEALRTKYVHSDSLPAILKEQIAQLDSEGSSVTSIVISGHHTDTYFGEAGSLSIKDIADTLLQYPRMIEKLRAVYAWDCYSSTIEEVYLWRAFFPAIDVVGFDDRAPSQRHEADILYLKSGLVAEARLNELAIAGDKAGLMALIRQVPGLAQNSEIRGAVSFGEFYYNVPNGMSSLNALNTCGPDKVEELRKGKQIFDLYSSAAQPGYFDVPADTAQSPLRAFYAQTLQTHLCPAAKEILNLSHRAIDLIFFKEIENSFGLVYASDLAELDRALRSQGADFSVPNMGNGSLASRHDIVEFENKLKDFDTKHASTMTSVKDANTVHSMSELVDILLINMYCVPNDWIENNVDVNNMPKASPECIAGDH